ncbi:MAG TPA: rhombosortase [Burkholderiaceae bacterium]|nr:rhombosortase [Burkholderiaceae bacterium]
MKKSRADYSDGHFAPRQRSPWSIGLLIVGVLALIGLQFALGREGVAAWRYDRARIVNDGQWWRLLTGSLVHLDLPHLLINVAGAFGVAWVFRRLTPWPRQVGLVAALAPLHLCVLLAFTRVEWVAGLSGALHGAFAAQALKLALMRSRPSDGVFGGPRLGLWMLGGLMLKLAADTFMPVAWAAHIAGAVVGLALTALAYALNRPANP